MREDLRPTERVLSCHDKKNRLIFGNICSSRRFVLCLRRTERRDEQPMDESMRDDRENVQPAQTKMSACPQCSSPVRVVTAVTVKTMGTDPRTVLVTYRCKSATCLFKYPIPKPEFELTDEERALWR